MRFPKPNNIVAEKYVAGMSLFKRKLAKIKLSVIPIDLDKPTMDFSESKAMSEEEVFSFMQLGFDSVNQDCDLLLLGEMGISNTTAATAIACALFKKPVEAWTGIGTGLDEKRLANKISVLNEGKIIESGSVEKIRRSKLVQNAYLGGDL